MKNNNFIFLILFILNPFLIRSQVVKKNSKNYKQASLSVNTKKQIIIPPSDTTFKTILLPAEFSDDLVKISDVGIKFIGIDGQNNIYAYKCCIGGKYNEFGKFNGTKWEWFADIYDKFINRIEIDDKDNVYAFASELSNRFNFSIYKLNLNGWELISPEKNNYLNNYSFLGNDSNIYSAYQGGNTFTLYKLTNGEWDKGNIPSLEINEHYRKIIVDKTGKIYLLGAKCKNCSDYSTFIWDGFLWKELKDTINPAFFGCDKNNQVYLGKVDKYRNVSFIKLLDTTWIEMETPIMRLSTYDLEYNVFITKGELFCRQREHYNAAQYADNFTENTLFNYIENEWKQVASYNDYEKYGYMFEFLFYLDNSLYLSKYNGENSELFRVTKKKVIDERPVIQKIYSIPIDKSNKLTEKEKIAWKKYRILNQDGKLGIFDANGNLFIYPVFDKITAVYNTDTIYDNDPPEIIFTCTQDNTEMKVILKNNNPTRLRCFGEKVEDCKKCKGKGVMPDHFESVETKGDWVDEKQSSTTVPKYENVWSTACNCYVSKITNVTTLVTTPGYRKPSTYKNVTIPGGICQECKGKKKIKTVTYYRFNYLKKKYEEELVVK